MLWQQASKELMSKYDDLKNFSLLGKYGSFGQKFLKKFLRFSTPLMLHVVTWEVGDLQAHS